MPVKLESLKIGMKVKVTSPEPGMDNYRNAILFVRRIEQDGEYRIALGKTPTANSWTNFNEKEVSKYPTGKICQ